MAHVEKLSVALTPELAAALRDAVSSGEYASASEVMREALRDWRLRKRQRGQAVDELRLQWDLGVASGPAQDGPATFARLRADLRAQDAD